MPYLIKNPWFATERLKGKIIELFHPRQDLFLRPLSVDYLCFDYSRFFDFVNRARALALK
jgi:hypothetical protein